MGLCAMVCARLCGAASVLAAYRAGKARGRMPAGKIRIHGKRAAPVRMRRALRWRLRQLGYLVKIAATAALILLSAAVPVRPATF